jgi:hypothetical protein
VLAQSSPHAKLEACQRTHLCSRLAWVMEGVPTTTARCSALDRSLFLPSDATSEPGTQRVFERSKRPRRRLGRSALRARLGVLTAYSAALRARLGGDIRGEERGFGQHRAWRCRSTMSRRLSYPRGRAHRGQHDLLNQRHPHLFTRENDDHGRRSHSCVDPTRARQYPRPSLTPTGAPRTSGGQNGPAWYTRSATYSSLPSSLLTSPDQDRTK